jgi:DNA ligase (NAD+)
LRELGVSWPNAEPAAGIAKPLTGHTYVLSGALTSLTREQAKQRLQKLGAKVSSSVSKKTTAVIAGEDPGSKYEKAVALGVPIIGEDELMDLIGTNAD